MTAPESAIREALAWDERRGFIMPYAVRDKLYAALGPPSAPAVHFPRKVSRVELRNIYPNPEKPR